MMLADRPKQPVKRSFHSMGQICVAVNRIYVHSSVEQEFLERMQKTTEALVIDNGLKNPDADIGPMASPSGLKKTEKHVADARENGANVLCGGKRPEGEHLAKGNFYLPTIIAGATPDMLVMREETFGPVVGVWSYEDDEEAVRLANDTPYGLAAYVYTKDLGEAIISPAGLSMEPWALTQLIRARSMCHMVDASKVALAMSMRERACLSIWPTSM